MLPFGNKWFCLPQTEIDNRSGWPCVHMGVETPPSRSCFCPFMWSSHARQVGCCVPCACCTLRVWGHSPGKAQPTILATFKPGSDPLHQQTGRILTDTSAVASPATTFNTVKLLSPAPDNQNCPKLGNKTFSTKNVQQPSAIAQNSPQADHFKDVLPSPLMHFDHSCKYNQSYKTRLNFWGWEVESLVQPDENRQFSPIF